MKVHCAHDKLIEISKLKPHPKNPNKHPAEQVERLAKILKYQGFRYPIKISKQTGFVTSGHGRMLAAKFNGWKKVPVNYQDYENEEQEYADMVADNSVASWAELSLSDVNLEIPNLGPDFDIDWLGIKDFELEPADKYGDKDADATPGIRETSIRLGDCFQMGNHRLLCGDSTDSIQVEKLMNGEKADMVFTDPPYGVSVVEKSSALKERGYRPVENDDSIDVALAAFGLAREISNNLVFWGGNYYAHKLPESGSWIIWLKKDNDSDQHDFEVAWLSVKGKMACFSHKWSGWWRDSEKGAERVHPTQKPVALAEWCFENYGKPKSVLDLFLGSGSTLIACEKTNRKCRGAEIDPIYCDVIVRRWMQFTGQMAYLIEDANGKLPSGPVPFADLSSMRSTTPTEENKSIVRKNAGKSVGDTEGQNA